MAQYPLMLDLTGRLCLVVGGGKVALRKVKGTSGRGARRSALSLKPASPELARMAESNQIELLEKNYATDDLNGTLLAISATDNPAINTQVAKDGKSHGIPVNIVDEPELCTFTVPASVYRGDLVISIAHRWKKPGR